jgi:chloramphenicol-sensitive protein RarD
MTAPRSDGGRAAAPAGDPAQATVGYAAAFGAFLIWGFAPVYFKAVAAAGPLEIVAWRIVWTVVMLAPLVAAIGRFGIVLAAFRTVRDLRVYLLSTALIATNWLVFIYAVLNDHLLQASLGYFINPLVNVLLGVVFLQERLNRRQLLAVLLAGIGVGNLVVGYGAVPWVSLTLAFSFGFYALVRKRARIDPLAGLLIETALLLPVAGAYVAWLAAAGTGSFWAGGWEITLLLVAAGVVTSAPLILFMIGAQRLPLSSLGLMQYLAPSLHFLLAVGVYGEAFTTAHLITFCAIWLGLALYTGDAMAAYRRSRRAAGPEPAT